MVIAAALRYVEEGPVELASGGFFAEWAWLMLVMPFVAFLAIVFYGKRLPNLGSEFAIGAMAFTGELTVRYTAPCPLGEELTFRARVAGEDGRKLSLECEGHDASGVMFAKATSTFITIDLEQFKQT